MEERGRRGWKNRHMRDNIPCREASAVKLAPDHTSKLDAVLVDPCFIHTVFVGEKGREKKREEKRKGERRERKRERKKERKEEGREKRRERGREVGEVKKEARTERKRERPPPPPPVLMSSTPPCVVSKRLRVKRQDARMCSTTVTPHAPHAHHTTPHRHRHTHHQHNHMFTTTRQHDTTPHTTTCQCHF